MAHKITMALWKAGVQSGLRVRPTTEELQLHADLPAARPDAEQCSREGREPREHPRALLVYHSPVGPAVSLRGRAPPQHPLVETLPLC